jgi:hypothetical protein
MKVAIDTTTATSQGLRFPAAERSEVQAADRGRSLIAP